ncbi:MAG: hypothetical protein A2X80_14805 [Geobacteraceae bacterium GWB2_52_12]|nr:MAG: hypothetical protein A2X80_14805 [Geobacteraceae bacterium GWB2_52_12]
MTFETLEFLDFFCLERRILFPPQCQVILGCLERLTSPFISHSRWLIGNLPIGADCRGVALITAARWRYASPGGEHCTPFQGGNSNNNEQQ